MAADISHSLSISPSSDSLALSVPVATIVARSPASSRVFERHRIDYCCRGGESLAAAANARGLDPESILAELRALSQPVDTDAETNAGLDRTRASMTELCDLIERTHHAFLRKELPRARELCAKVVRAHGKRYPEVTQIAEALEGFHEELESHMLKEEHVLFPILRRLERGDARVGLSPEGPIACMMQEHDDAGATLVRIRGLAADFTPPADACPTFRVLYESLSSIERDMHMHVHTENWILFPKARLES